MTIPAHIIAFKDTKTEAEFASVSPRLQDLILVAGGYMHFTHGITLVITDLMRDDLKSVHGYGNGVDFRTSNLTEAQGDDLVEFLKWKLPYYMKLPMPDRPRYSVRDERKPGTSRGWTGEHLHAQVNYRES